MIFPSRERKRATSSHRLQRARNTRLITLKLDSYSSEAMNLVFALQKPLAEWVARSRSRLGFGVRTQSAMNLVFVGQKRLAE